MVRYWLHFGPVPFRFLLFGPFFFLLAEWKLVASNAPTVVAAGGNQKNEWHALGSSSRVVTKATAAAAIFPELTAVKNVISGAQTCAHPLEPLERGGWVLGLKEAFCLSAANE